MQKEAEKKYGSNNVTTVGSSFGGYLVEYRQNSKEVISTSKPTTPLDIFKGKKKGKKKFQLQETLQPCCKIYKVVKTV